MTKSELQSIEGFHPGTLMALATYLRIHIPRRFGADPTTLVHHEGRTQGYLDAVEMIESAAGIVAPEKERIPSQPYSRSQFPENPQTK